MSATKQVQLPDELAQALERRAAAHSISVEEQIVRDLSLVETELGALNETELLAEVRRDREAMARRGIKMTDEFLARAKAWGRK
jgi:plasmid stability protein